MFRPPNFQSSFFLCLTLVTCIVAQDYAPAHYDWNDDTYRRLSGVEEISVDMEDLSSMRNCTIELYEDSTDYVFLRILASKSNSLEPCSQQSNKLLLERDSANESAMLLCGNEIVEMHTTRFFFTLTFVKGSGTSESQLNNFKITLDRSFSFPYSKYQPITVSSTPGILYSPLYPNFYEENLSLLVELHVKEGYAVFFQLRFMKLEDGCLDALTLRGGDDYNDVSMCRMELTTAVMKPRSYSEGISAYFKTDDSIQHRGFEIEFRSVKIGSRYLCSSKYANSTFYVKEATLVSLGLGDGYLDIVCSLTFKANASQQLVLTSLTSKDYWSNICHNFAIRVFVGDRKLPQRECNITTFGVIRAPPGQEVRVNFYEISSYPYHMPDDYLTQFSFVVEAYESDALPEAVNAHPSPSYIWIPGFTGGNDATKGSAEGIITQVRSAVHHCVEFSILNKKFEQNKQPLGNSVSLYSGIGTTENYMLAEDCLGKLRSDSIVNNGRNRITTAVSGRKTSYWMNISEKSDKPCDAPPTYLEINFDNIIYSLFGWMTISASYYKDYKIPIKKHMTCKFILPPKVSVPGTPTAIQFRGQLTTKDDAELYVTEGEKTPHIMTNFRRIDRDAMSAWFYSSSILYIYFRTGSDVSDDMAQFEYRFASEADQVCSGISFKTLTETWDYFTPSYPNYLPTNTTCKWKFKRPAGVNKYIHVLVENLDLSCDSSTKLFIKGTNDAVLSPSPVCDVEEFRKVFPGDVEIDLMSGPDNVIGGIKFHMALQALDYESVCNRTYEIEDTSHGIDLKGTLHDGHYLVPFYCKIHLHVDDPGGKLTVLLKKVNIANSYFSFNCYDKNGLTIYDGGSTSSPMLIHTCYSNGETVASIGNSVLVEISIREQVDHPVTFDLSIKRTLNSACSGVTKTLQATDDSQFITSPGYPDSYEPNSDCSWTVESANGDEVEIEIVDMDLEYSRTCSFDYVEVHDGATPYDASLGRVCGEEKRKPKFRSSSEVLYVRFISDMGDEDNGFKMRYYTKLYPSPGLEDGHSGSTYPEDNKDGSNNTSNNKTGVIIGACLSAIVGIFGLGFLCVCLVHKKRMNDLRNRRRRRRDAAATYHQHRSGQESSVYVINPLIVNNAPPPPYSGLINQGFLEEPPPSYRDALSQLAPPPPLPAISEASPGRAPPPPYSISIPRGHEAISEDEEVDYANSTPHVDNNTGVPIYETIQPVRRQVSSASQEESNQNQRSEQLEQQQDRPSSPSSAAAAILQLPESQNHHHCPPRESLTTENNAVSSSALSSPPSNLYSTVNSDYNSPEGDYTYLRCGDVEDHNTSNLATEPPTHSNFSPSRERPSMTTIDLTKPETSSPISNHYSLARQPDKETRGEYNHVYPPENDGNAEYSLAHIGIEKWDDDYDLARNSEASSESENNTQRQKSSYSFSDEETDHEYSLVLDPSNSNGTSAEYRSPRARSNSDNNYSQNNGAIGSDLAVHTNINNQEDLGAGPRAARRGERAVPGRGSDRTSDEISRARSPVNGEVRNNPRFDYGPRRNNRLRRDDSLGAL